MEKIKAKAMQEQYGMEILRHPVTGEAWGLYLVSDHCIKDLDDLAGADITPCAMKACYDAADHISYTLACPTDWFDLWGWAED